MSILEILKFPDDRLRTIAKPVEAVTEEVKQLVDDMFETMYAAPGIGLAATQVNAHKRIVVIDVSPDKDAPLCLINPVITAKDGIEQHEEGCLSVPGIYETVERAERIEFTALNRNGEEYKMSADDLLAVCVQHELDHLQGKLFVDYLSPLKRNRIKKKMEKHQKTADM
ncbi:MAG: peptide deformylase [endosymbiont of Galathealinum brachiosum]|uniref:Peptide deformylase n=1 Tax=endosymbiont of Galathealinum brachiosum TaxID=2200906 RepID=A0A370DD61_9GAMM|nr:MAG: peptide deformylase [endosymbiont of Galathealinum brachiosum]